MRIALTLACPELLPFDHLPLLKSAFHRWTGHNPELHDKDSLYSYSWLCGGRMVNGQLFYKKKITGWTISTVAEGVGHQLLAGIVGHPSLEGHGLSVQEVQLVPAPVFTAGEHRFELASPILVYTTSDRGKYQLRYTDPATEDLLTGLFQRKLRRAGLSATGVRVRFEENAPGAGTQLVRYKGIVNLVNNCPVLVTGSAEQLALAWCAGIGHSTGIGFGALK